MKQNVQKPKKIHKIKKKKMFDELNANVRSRIIMGTWMSVFAVGIARSLTLIGIVTFILCGVRILFIWKFHIEMSLDFYVLFVLRFSVRR